MGTVACGDFTDFSVNSVSIYLESNFDPMLRQDFSLNQIFRIVIVPGFFSEMLDSTDYDSVINSLREGNIEIQQKEIQVNSAEKSKSH